jgi:hypothetical protein
MVNIIFSPELGAGLLPYEWPDGLIPDPYGQALAPVSHSPLPVKKLEPKIIGTYGRYGVASSQSVGLQSSLENKLRQRLPMGGLTPFMTHWKRKATPLGRWYSQLVPLVRPTVASAYGLWDTPTAQDFKRRGPNSKQQGLSNADRMLWGMPTASDWKGKGNLNTLRLQVHGMKATGQSVWMGSTGRYQLNPLFSLWLMGFPAAARFSLQVATQL